MVTPGIRKHRFARDIVNDADQLCQLDNWHGPLAVLLDLTVISTAIAACCLFGWAAYPVTLVLIGSRQRALATIVHEAAHGTLTRSKSLARVLGTFFSGYLIFSTLSAYKRSHVARHHGRFGDSELDDDYRYMLEKGLYSGIDRRELIIKFIVRPLLLGNVASYLVYIIKARTFSANNHAERIDNLFLCAYWTLLLAALWASNGLLPLLLFWIIPFLTTFQVIGWFIELAEHGPLMQNGWDLHMTRNRHSHWLEHMLTGMHGENYHLAHHLRPRVPFWRLPELHRILKRDRDYFEWDRQCGGIFLSRGRARPVIEVLQARGRA